MAAAHNENVKISLLQRETLAHEMNPADHLDFQPRHVPHNAERQRDAVGDFTDDGLAEVEERRAGRVDGWRELDGATFRQVEDWSRWQ